MTKQESLESLFISGSKSTKKPSFEGGGAKRGSLVLATD